MSADKSDTEITRIPDEIKPVILTQFREGKSYDEIILYLKQQYDLQLSIRIMTRFIKSSREMRQEVAKEQYALAVADSCQKDIHTIDVVIRQLEVQFLEELNNKKTYQATACAKTMLE